MTDTMDVVPRKVIRMVQLGIDEKLENLKTCWVCASCHSCNVVCPRGVDLPRVMEALRKGQGHGLVEGRSFFERLKDVFSRCKKNR